MPTAIRRTQSGIHRRTPATIGRWLAVLAGLALCACSTRGFVRSSADTDFRPPRSIVVIAPEVSLEELSNGGIKEQLISAGSEISRRFEGRLMSQAKTELKTRADTVPILSDAQITVLNEHRALFALEANALHEIANPRNPVSENIAKAWAFKKEGFDYSLGGGLRFLGAASNADAALFAVIQDRNSTFGRKFVRFIQGSLSTVTLGLVEGAERDQPGMFALGMVDLKTGDLLWFDSMLTEGYDIRLSSDISRMCAKLLESYPRQWRRNEGDR